MIFYKYFLLLTDLLLVIVYGYYLYHIICHDSYPHKSIICWAFVWAILSFVGSFLKTINDILDQEVDV